MLIFQILQAIPAHDQMLAVEQYQVPTITIAYNTAFILANILNRQPLFLTFLCFLFYFLIQGSLFHISVDEVSKYCCQQAKKHGLKPCCIEIMLIKSKQTSRRLCQYLRFVTPIIKIYLQHKECVSEQTYCIMQYTHHRAHNEWCSRFRNMRERMIMKLGFADYIKEVLDNIAESTPKSFQKSQFLRFILFLNKKGISNNFLDSKELFLLALTVNKIKCSFVKNRKIFLLMINTFYNQQFRGLFQIKLIITDWNALFSGYIFVCLLIFQFCFDVHRLPCLHLLQI